MATVISSKKSNVGSPYCYYTLAMTYSNRTGTTVKVSWTLTAKLAESSSYMGYPLTAYIYAGGYYQSESLKGTSGWSGTSAHTFSGSFTVKGLSASTTSISTALKVVSGAPHDACQLNKYSGSNLSISTPTKYTVSYNANGGSGAPSSQTKYYGTTLKLSTTKPTRSGYTFIGWGLSSTDTSVNYSAGANYTTNASDTLYAIWKKTITLSYNSNGGSGAPSSSSATVYNATTSKTFTVSSTKPTRTGYNFKGWSKSSSASSADYVSGNSITLSSSDTLYAVWSKKTYTVSYNANGGTGAPSSQTKTYGVTLTLSTTKPTRASLVEEDTITTYTFKGWATSSTATSATYKAGSSYTANASATLYAVWGENETDITYDIIYNTQGGSNISSGEKKSGTDFTITTIEPTKDGYNFKTWNTVEDGSGKDYSPGSIYTTDDDLILYAIWIPWTHTVNFNANGGTGIPSSFTKTTNVDATIPEEIPARSGHIFYAWNTKSDGSGDFYYPGNSYEHIQNGGTVTLYAIWISTDILIYDNGNCRATNFEEGAEYLSFINNGTIKAIEFIEGSTLNIDETAFYITEIKEGE